MQRCCRQASQQAVFTAPVSLECRAIFEGFLQEKACFLQAKLLLRLFQNIQQAGLHFRQILLNGTPHSDNVDPKVLMDQLVAHSRHIFPRQLRMLCSETFRKIFSCLTDYFELPDNSILCHVIAHKVRNLHVVNILLNSSDSIKNMAKINRIVFHE